MAIVPIDAFLGEHNVADEKSLMLGSMALSSNVDINNEGIVSSRDGFSLSQSFASLTASFAASNEQRLFIIENGDLKLVNDDFTTLILKSNMPSTYVKWLEVADYIFLSTGDVITVDNQVLDWRFPVPDQPFVTVGGGYLPAGQYQVTTTYSDLTGREGAASVIVVIDVPINSSLAVTPSFITGYDTNIYVTDVEGSVFYLHSTKSGGSAVVTETGNLSYPIDKQQLDSQSLPEEIGSIAFYDGSVWVSQYINNVTYLFRSKPFWWHLFDLQSDYIAIQGKVTALQGTPQGLFIGTDDEMYVYSMEESLVRIAEYGVVQGKPIAVTDQGLLFVWTNQGVCSLFPFQNLTEDKVSLPAGCICSTAIIERNGYEQFMVLNDGSGTAFNKIQ